MEENIVYRFTYKKQITFQQVYQKFNEENLSKNGAKKLIFI